MVNEVTYWHHGGAGGVLTQSGEAVQVEHGDGLVLVLCKAERLEGELGSLGDAVQVQHGLWISGTPEGRQHNTLSKHRTHTRHSQHTQNTISTHRTHTNTQSGVSLGL